MLDFVHINGKLPVSHSQNDKKINEHKSGIEKLKI